MNEIVKRLTPKGNVLSRLFAVSGNVCAFPECNHLMINVHGKFVGQVCHIKAANEGGERFDLNMTNEQRRSFDNLMLMCYQHHQETNNVQEYTVEVLQDMKNDHENMFMEDVVIQSILANLKDYTQMIFTNSHPTLKGEYYYNIWLLIKNYCKSMDFDLTSYMESLDFSDLDEVVI